MRINGILGTCKSLKDNSLKTAAEMEIGEGGTQSWYLGGPATNSTFCVVVSLSEANNSENRERVHFFLDRMGKFKP